MKQCVLNIYHVLQSCEFRGVLIQLLCHQILWIRKLLIPNEFKCIRNGLSCEHENVYLIELVLSKKSLI